MPGIDTIPELMSIDQFAQRLGITVRHVRRLVADKRIPYLKVASLSASTLTRSQNGSTATDSHRPVMSAAVQTQRVKFPRHTGYSWSCPGP